MTTDTDLLQRFLFEGAGVRGEFVRLGSSFRALLDNHDYPPAIARQVGKALAKLGDIPVDVYPTYTTAETLLKAK